MVHVAEQRTTLRRKAPALKTTWAELFYSPPFLQRSPLGLTECGAVVVAKWLELLTYNVDVPNLNPPGARAFFSSSIDSRVSLIKTLKKRLG